MIEKKRATKTWYRFIDKNKVYDYKSLYNAISWAETKVKTSTSKEIRIFKLRKIRHGGVEIQCVVFTKVDKYDNVLVAWRDRDIFREYKEKENRVRMEESQKSGSTAGYAVSNTDNI